MSPLLVLNSCGDQVCDFAAKPGLETSSPLIPVETLSEQLMSNLAASKASCLGPADVFVASIHGSYGPYTGEVPQSCSPADERLVRPTCSSSNGTAESGDRYEAFLRTFPEGQFYPSPNTSDPSAPLQGLICQADFGDPLTEIGRLIGE